MPYPRLMPRHTLSGDVRPLGLEMKVFGIELGKVCAAKQATRRKS